MEAINNQYDIRVKSLYNHCIHLVRNINGMHINASRKKYDIDEITKKYHIELNKLTDIKNSLLAKLESTNITIPEPVREPLHQPVTEPRYEPGYKPVFNALLVGINYKMTKYELQDAINNMNNISSYINKIANKKNVVVLTDADATSDNIIKEFTSLLVNSKSGDKLFFSFNGHTSKSNLLVSIDMKRICGSLLNRIIQANLPSGVSLFMLLDSCNINTSLDLKYKHVDHKRYSNVNINSSYPDTKESVYCISASCDNSHIGYSSIDNNNIKTTYQGAITWAFLKTINQNNSLTWNALLTNMNQLLRESKYTQLAVFSSGKECNINALSCF